MLLIRIELPPTLTILIIYVHRYNLSLLLQEASSTFNMYCRRNCIFRLAILVSYLETVFYLLLLSIVILFKSEIRQVIYLVIYILTLLLSIMVCGYEIWVLKVYRFQEGCEIVTILQWLIYIVLFMIALIG